MTRVLAIIASVGVAAATAAADPAPPANKSDAKELLQLGVKLLNSKDYLGALALFKDAYHRFPSAKILLDIGTTLRALGRNAEAANAYQGYLDSSETNLKLKDEVTRALADLDRDLARLAIALAPGAPAGTELQVDATEWSVATPSAIVRVAPGAYTVHARHEGFRPFEAAGQIAVGQQVAVEVVLDAIPRERVIVRVPNVVPIAVAEPRNRLGLLALGHLDLGGGGAAFIGATADATAHLELQLAAILGPNFGGYAGASFSFLTDTVRPFLALGVPVFSSSGARFAARAAAGLELAANRHFAVILELGIERALNPQDAIIVGGMTRTLDKTSFIPAVGVSTRL